MGCNTVTINDDPIGSFTLAQSRGALHLTGWALDRELKTTALTTVVRIDGGAPRTFVARTARPDVATSFPGAGPNHGLDQYLGVAEGTHTVCITVRNVGFGSDLVVPCRSVTLHFTPTAALSSITGTRTGLAVTGWATDPDTSAPVTVRLTVDGGRPVAVLANGSATGHTGHAFTYAASTRSGAHTVCATALNLAYGTHDSARVCRTITLALSPLAYLDGITRSGNGLAVTGWSFDPDTTASTRGHDHDRRPGEHRGRLDRPVPTSRRPTRCRARRTGSPPSSPRDDNEHRVCITAINVGGGTNVDLGCRVINAVHPVAPAPVTGVRGHRRLQPVDRPVGRPGVRRRRALDGVRRDGEPGRTDRDRRSDHHDRGDRRAADETASTATPSPPSTSPASRRPPRPSSCAR